MDDEPTFRAVLRATLGDDERFEVVDEGSNGHQAVALANLHQPDVVVLDLMMPELDGVSAAAQVRAEAPSALLVMLSSREARAAEQA
ncbi:MAG: response regulator transcription factor, partial [Acidimicrobiales bacterium]